MKKKWINMLCCCLLAMGTTAQTAGYRYHSDLDSVRHPGFYNIDLSPEINAHLKTDYNDVRIVNAAGKWVPHVLNVESDIMREAILRKLKYTITESNRQQTVLLIEADHYIDITHNIILAISNTAALRTCTLSGSDDQKNWFVINDSIALNPYPGIVKTDSEIRIPVPSSSYSYFKVVINNQNKDPFNILKVSTAIPEGGFSPDYFPVAKLVQNPAVQVTQKDSGNISYIKVVQPGDYHFDRISYHLSGAKFFNRRVQMYIPAANGGSFSAPGKLYHSFTIADNSSYNVKVPVANSRIFYLLIYNEDNPPLRMDSIFTSLNQRFITAYLESGGRYQLIMSNDAAAVPSYDLKIADSIIISKQPFLNHGEIKILPQVAEIVPPKKNNKWMLWTVLAVVLATLGYFTYKMIKEVDKKKTL